MKRITQGIMVVVALFLVITACKKSQNTPAPALIHDISKIETDSNVVETAYNIDGSIQSITRKQSNGTNALSYVFSYENGKIKEVNFGAKWKYYYTGNLVDYIETYSASGVLRHITRYAYVNDKISEKAEYLVNTNNTERPYAKTKFYYNTEGNVTKKEGFDHINGDWRKEEEVLVNSYDAHPNKSEHLENLPYLPLSFYSVNNPINETYINDIGQNAGSVVHVYEYDANGRPLKRKTTYSFIGFPDFISDSKITY